MAVRANREIEAAEERGIVPVPGRTNPLCEPFGDGKSMKQVVLDDVLDGSKTTAVQFERRRINALDLGFRESVCNVLAPVDESMLIDGLRDVVLIERMKMKADRFEALRPGRGVCETRSMYQSSSEV